MKDVIDILLKKQATLEEDREAEKALACEKIDAEYAERSCKIAALLDMAGYVPEIEEIPEAAAEAEADADAYAVAPTDAAQENGEQRTAMRIY